MNAVVLKDGDYAYEVVEGWGRLPDGWRFEDVAAVAIDAEDRVYVFNRGEHPMIVFDRAGNFLRSWGEGVFNHPHGLDIGRDGAIYCTDDGDHTVRKFDLDGRLLLEIGIPGRPSPRMSSRPFCRCTHTALSPRGDIYVSDGYGNACIHKFSPDGKLLKTWGELGSRPGQFFLPHNLVCDSEGWVYVADRENHRIQVFDGEGNYETQWNNLVRPCAVCMGREATPLFYVGEAGPAPTVGFPGLGPRLSIFDGQGELVARVGDIDAGIGPGRFIAPHGIATDSAGDICIGEVSYSAWPAVFPGEPRPEMIPTLHRLRKLNKTG